MANGRRNETLLQALVDSCYSLLLERYRTEQVEDFSCITDPLLKQAQRVLRQARSRGVLPTGYEGASERLLDRTLRLRPAPAYDPSIEVVRNLSHRDVNRLIRSQFRLEGYDCAQDWRNEHIECPTVSLKHYGKEARRRVARWRKDSFNEEPELEELLCELVRCGVLPEGNYEIWVDG
jgi:hypothetical protein